MLKIILKLDACGTLPTWIPACAGMTLWVVRVANEHSPSSPREAMALRAA
jgi:hypothetical protein